MKREELKELKDKEIQIEFIINMLGEVIEIEKNKQNHEVFKKKMEKVKNDLKKELNKIRKRIRKLT